MQTISDPCQMQLLSEKTLRQGQDIGFVPTMGYLHEGHLSLMRRAKTENEMTVASIFVNPTQFAPGEDLSKYPRDLSRDQRLAAAGGVDILFCPKETDVYPAAYATKVTVENLGAKLCGQTRPNHFQGVTTIVAKLLNIVKPQRAYFGQKDAQQFVIIDRMVRDLNFDTELYLLPTVREADGLALSSRNVYLNPVERDAARILFLALEAARSIIAGGVKNIPTILAKMTALINSEDLALLDYLAAVDLLNLEPVLTLGEDPVLIALAVYIGQTRLIDNIIINREKYGH